MADLINKLRAAFEKHEALAPGFIVYHTPPEADTQYRLHLRIEPDGEGVLIVNASSILHLNQTATEIAYFMMNGKNEREVAEIIRSRYLIPFNVAQADVQDFFAKLKRFVNEIDLRPDQDFGFDLHTDYGNLSAPYRLDCCLTYDLESTQANPAEPAPQAYLSTDAWKTIIKKSFDASIPHLIFYGGEPSLREDLPELLRYAEDLGMVTGLVSSGRKLGDPVYVQQLIASGLDHLLIPWVLNDIEMRRALDHILPLDLYTCINLPVDLGFDYEALINELKDLGANAFSLAPAKPEAYDKYLQLSSYIEKLEGVDLVQEVPLPVFSQDFHREAELLQAPIDDSAYAVLDIDPYGKVWTSFDPKKKLGDLVSEDWKTIWDCRPKNEIA